MTKRCSLAAFRMECRQFHHAVAHVMYASAPCTSVASFVVRNPRLLDRTIMLKHDSVEALFSPEARQTFVQPNICPIPEP